RSLTLATANCQSASKRQMRQLAAGPAPALTGRRRRSLLLPRGHDEHPVDLVARGLVLDAAADAPHAPQPPFIEEGGILVDQPLGSGIARRGLRGVGRRAAR